MRPLRQSRSQGFISRCQLTSFAQLLSLPHTVEEQQVIVLTTLIDAHAAPLKIAQDRGNIHILLGLQENPGIAEGQ